jgi:hypothetical protein
VASQGRAVCNIASPPSSGRERPYRQRLQPS